MENNHRKKLGKIGWLATILALLAFGGFAGFNRPVSEIVVQIHDQDQNQFVNEEDVQEVIREIGRQNPGVLRYDNVNLAHIEREIEQLDFIKEAQVAQDLKGNILVDIYQNSPMARIMAQNGNGGYLSKTGQLLTLSDRYTSRVITITGAGADSLLSPTYLLSPEGLTIKEMLFFIDNNEFWKAQIAQIDIDEKMSLTLFPQLGKEEVLFGSVENYRKKFWKLGIFYDKIIPNRGWNTFSKVKLGYDGQIVCE